MCLLRKIIYGEFSEFIREKKLHIIYIVMRHLFFTITSFVFCVFKGRPVDMYCMYFSPILYWVYVYSSCISYLSKKKKKTFPRTISCIKGKCGTRSETKKLR